MPRNYGGRSTTLPPYTEWPTGLSAGYLLVAVDVANINVRLSAHGRRLCWWRLAEFLADFVKEAHIHAFDTGRNRDEYVETLIDSPRVTLRTHVQPRCLSTNVDASLVLFISREVQDFLPDGLLLLSGDGDFLPLLDWTENLPSAITLAVLAVPGSLSGYVTRYLGSAAQFIGLDLTEELP